MPVVKRIKCRFGKPEPMKFEGYGDEDFSCCTPTTAEDDVIREQAARIAQLEAQLKQARVCGSCKYWPYTTGSIECATTAHAQDETCPDWTPIGGE